MPGGIVLSLSEKMETATEHDLDQILELQKKAFYSQALIYNDFDLHPLRQTIDDIKNEFKEKQIYKVQTNGRIIASIRCYVRNDTLYIEKLIVDPDFQNRGIGTKIMTEIEKRYAASVNRYALFTGHKSEKNLHIYKQLGYKETRRETLRDDLKLIDMEKANDKNIS